MSAVISIARLALGITFALSAVSKIHDPLGFSRGVSDYQVLPRRASFAVAVLVILCECFLAVCHFAGWLLPIAVPLGIGLLCGFVAAISINLRRQRYLPCYCFGGRDGQTISPRSIARLGIAIMGESVLLITLNATHASAMYAIDNRSSRDLVLHITLALFVVVACVWLLDLSDVVRIARHQFYRATTHAFDERPVDHA